MAVPAGSAGWGRGHGGRIAGPPPAPQTAARALFFGCALLVGTGTLLAGAAPALLCAAGPVLVQGALSVWFLHSMQRLNDAIPSDRRATLISVDSMAYSLLMIPASPLVGLVGDPDRPGGRRALCTVRTCRRQRPCGSGQKRAIMGAEHNYPIFGRGRCPHRLANRRQNPDDI